MLWNDFHADVLPLLGHAGGVCSCPPHANLQSTHFDNLPPLPACYQIASHMHDCCVRVCTWLQTSRGSRHHTSRSLPAVAASIAEQNGTSNGGSSGNSRRSYPAALPNGKTHGASSEQSSQQHRLRVCMLPALRTASLTGANPQRQKSASLSGSSSKLWRTASPKRAAAKRAASAAAAAEAAAEAAASPQEPATASAAPATQQQPAVKSCGCAEGSNCSCEQAEQDVSSPFRFQGENERVRLDRQLHDCWSSITKPLSTCHAAGGFAGVGLVGACLTLLTSSQGA